MKGLGKRGGPIHIVYPLKGPTASMSIHNMYRLGFPGAAARQTLHENKLVVLCVYPFKDRCVQPIEHCVQHKEAPRSNPQASILHVEGVRVSVSTVRSLMAKNPTLTGIPAGWTPDLCSHS